MRDAVLPAPHVQLEPRLFLPVHFIDVGVDKLEPVVHARALDAHAQVALPKVELRLVEAGLSVEVSCVLVLRLALGGNLFLDVGNLGLEQVAARGLFVAARIQVGDGVVHFRLLLRFFCERLLVRLALERQDFDVALLLPFVLCAVLASAVWVCDGLRTLQLGDAQAELVALLQHPLPALLDKVIEACGEGVHALPKVVESKVDAWQGIGHRRRIGGEGYAHGAGRQRRLKSSGGHVGSVMAGGDAGFAGSKVDVLEKLDG